MGVKRVLVFNRKGYRLMIPRYLKANGSAYPCGQMIGKNWHHNIKTVLKAAEKAAIDKDGMTLHDWLPHARSLLPYIKEYAPATLEEMRGMAQGSRLPFDDILLLTCAYEKWFNYHTPEHCTGFAAMGDASLSGDLVTGQNNDECFHHWAAGDMDGVIHFKDETGMETLVYTHPGIPAYMGMNSAGLCILWMAIDNGERSPGVPTNVLIREVLRLKSLQEAVKFLERTPRTLPNNFLLSHPTEGICNIECSPASFFPAYDKMLLLHANHILTTNMNGQDMILKNSTSSTVSRYTAMGSLLEKYKNKIDIDIAKNILSDHSFFPNSICAHPKPDSIYSKTMASMIFLPESGSMHIAFGNGCEMPYEIYSFSK